MGRNAETHIRVTEETWEQLNRKKGPGDSFEDVITGLLDEEERSGERGGATDAPDADTVAEEPDFGLKHEEPDVHDDRDPQPAEVRLGACRGDSDDVSVIDTGTVTVGLAAKIAKGDVFEGDDFRATVEGVNKSFIDIRLLHHQDDPELQRVDDISVLDVLSAEYELNERSISDPPAAEVE